jgi:hypothetical protein
MRISSRQCPLPHEEPLYESLLPSPEGAARMALSTPQKVDGGGREPLIISAAFFSSAINSKALSPGELCCQRYPVGSGGPQCRSAAHAQGLDSLDGCRTLFAGGNTDGSRV